MLGTDREHATLASRLRDLIEANDGGDLAAAGSRTGVSPRTLMRLLNGNTRAPSARTIACIANGYDCDATWLLTGELELGRAKLSGPELAIATRILFDLSRKRQDGRPPRLATA